MVTQLRNTPPAPDDAQAVEDVEHLPKVERVLKALTKLIHGRKLYAENNPRLGEFAREFRTALQMFFRVEDDLVLTIDQYTIDWRGQRVYESTKREESIAFLLHRDGVGEITIGAAAVGDETESLVKILTDEFHNLSSEEDVVTKFWNADFEHISYRVLDDYLSLEYRDAPDAADAQIPETADHPEMLPSLADKGRVIVEDGDPIESIDGYLKKLILRTCKSSDESEQEAYFQSMVGSFFTVSNEELERYHQELEKEKDADGIADFLETVFVFTLLQDNPSAVRDVSGVVERLVEYAVEDLDPRTLRRILNLLHGFRESQPVSEGVESLCDKLENAITEGGVIQSLGEKLKYWNKDSEQILAYLGAVGRGVVDPLLKVLHNVEGDKLHKEICDVLVDVAGDDIGDVMETMDVDNPEIAYDAVYIANKTGMKKMSPKIQELLFYPDVRVKEQMIDLVRKMDDPSSVDLLLGAMSDENKQIRLRAMEAAADRNDPRILERISELAFSKDLSEREMDEQEEVFVTLGRVGNAGTVGRLKKFVEKKSLIQFGKNREQKSLAIRALEHIHSPASLAQLRKMTEDTNNLVQARAKRAYDALAEAMRQKKNEQQ